MTPPEPPAAEPPRRGAFGRWLWLATLLADLAVVAMVGLVINENRRHAIEQAQALTENYARILEEGMSGFIGRIDLTLLAVIDELEAGKARGGLESTAIDAILRRHDRRIPEALGLRVVDSSGIVRHAVSNAGSLRADISDRPHFIRLKEDPSAGLVISKPVMGRVAKKPVVTLARRYRNPDGSFAGNVHASVAIEQFIATFAKLNLGPQGNCGLWDRTTLIARYSRQDPSGAMTGATTPSPQLRELLNSGNRSASYHAVSGIDGITRLYQFRQVGDYPLYMVVGLADEDFLAEWKAESRHIGILAGLLILATLVFASLVHAAWMRRQQAVSDLEDSENRLRQIFDSVSDAIFIHDAETGRIFEVNRRMSEMYGHTRDEALRCTIADLSAPDPAYSPERASDIIDKARKGEAQIFEWRARARDGRLFWVEVSLRLARIGRRPCLLAAVRDVSQRKESEAQLLLAASVFASSYEGIVITDADNRITDVNPAFTRITGYTRADALGQDPRMLASGRHGQRFYEAMWDSLKQKGFWRGEIWNRRRNGEVYPEMLAVSAILGDAGSPRHYIGVFSDISVLKRHEAELDRIAHYDALTGVPNRRLLDDRLRQAIARADGGGHLLAVCYLDLDGFKPVNDRLGHGAGDALLVEMSHRLQGQLRANDTLARLGGDEFVLLLSDLSRPEDCNQILGRVRAVVTLPVDIEGEAVSVSASIGVTLCPPDDPDADTLLRHADQAMYRAKEQGKNCFHVFDPEQDRQVKAHRHRQQRLRAALEQGEFVLHYQPKVDLVDRRVVGVEALIRWQHPDDGLLLPGAFLNSVNGTDLESAIGEWVMDTALAQAAVWHRAGLGLSVSVNISANHLLQLDFAERLHLTLERHPDIGAANLELEILETAALSDMERATHTLSRCRQLGVRFALDDFGTGYSSLAYFRKLPVDALKIDQSFVQNMLDDPTDLDIVESVVRLAEAFNRPVIAEGVETLEHGAMLLMVGCRLAQGWGIARPMPADSVPAWIEGWQREGAGITIDGAAANRENLPLLVAAQSHRHWIRAFEEKIRKGESPAPVELDSRQCRFGRWYFGSGATRYGTLPEFVAIAPLHERIHAQAAEIAELVRAGRQREAGERLANLHGDRDELLACVDTLIKTVSAPDARTAGAPPRNASAPL